MFTSILWSDKLQFRVDEVKRENETISISITCTNQKSVGIVRIPTTISFDK
jgi:hypothetical protein